MDPKFYHIREIQRYIRQANSYFLKSQKENFKINLGNINFFFKINKINIF